MVILNAVQSVLSILIMISVGYFLTFKGWLDDSTSKLFSKIIINISLPAYMLSNLMTTFTKDKLNQAGVGIIIPFISMAICFLISIVVSKLFKIKKERLGTFQCMFYLSNTIFIGLPVNLSLFGDQSLPYVLYYYIANTTIFWTIGMYGIKKDGGSKEKGIFTLDTLKRIFSPPLMGFIVAIILILLQIELPKSIMDSAKYLGNLTTPLSMLFIGIVIRSIDIKDLKLDLDMTLVLVGRFIISPLVTFAFCYYLKAPLLMKKVFIIQASLPVMTQTAIATKLYGADYKYGAVMVTITTIASLIFIPIYMYLMTFI